MRRILFFALLIATAGVAAAVWSLGGSLAAPVPREIGPPPSTLSDGSAVSFASASGNQIHAWFAPGRHGQGAIVLAHGVRQNRRSMVSRAEFLHEAGYSVLLFDSQAHGESPGDHITFGYLEALDAAAAVSFVISQQPDSPVAFLGVSQGGAAALLGPTPLPVSALVLESVYSTIQEAVANRIAVRLGEPGRLLAPLFVWQLESRIGVRPESVAPIRRIDEIQAPLLLIAGGRDRHSTLGQSRRLFDEAPEPKELWVLPEAEHQDFHRFEPREYELRVLEFFSRILGGAA